MTRIQDLLTNTNTLSIKGSYAVFHRVLSVPYKKETSHLKLSTVRINYKLCHKTHYHSVLIKLSLCLYA